MITNLDGWNFGDKFIDPQFGWVGVFHSFDTIEEHDVIRFWKPNPFGTNEYTRYVSDWARDCEEI